MSELPTTPTGSRYSHSGREDDLDDIERYNQPIELEHVDLSDTTGLLDEESIDDDNHPMADRRRDYYKENPDRSKILHYVLILFTLFFIGAILLFSYRLLNGTTTPVTPPVTLTSKINLLLEQSWPATLCSVSNATLVSFCQKKPNNFVISNLSRLDGLACDENTEYVNTDEINTTTDLWLRNATKDYKDKQPYTCIPTRLSSETKRLHDPKVLLDSVLNTKNKLIDDATLKQFLDRPVPISELIQKLENEKKSTFIECYGNDERKKVLKVFSCLETVVTQKTSDWKQITCSEQTWEEGVKKQTATCGTSNVFIETFK
ncbi:pentatricopeptide repeat-containing protein [Acrasis kona]|uniref:Pentatricopeptide repeat-containing protein n=1 Tax=Acrasis kona TaxID=1008807 RepID=A0AAW2YNC5_9EUKA